MRILNVGFVVDNDRFPEVCSWLAETASRFADPHSGVSGHELLEVEEVPGDPDFGKEGRHVSLQITFPERRDLDGWVSTRFPELMREYSASFGDPLVFMTVLKRI